MAKICYPLYFQMLYLNEVSYFPHQLKNFSAEAGQVIRALSVSTELRGFGISFSTGLDLDRNGLIDFAIGEHNL